MQRTLRWVVVSATVWAVVLLAYPQRRSGEASTTELAKMNSLKLEERAGVTYFGQGKLEKRDGIFILHLKGSPYEMGYQTGKLLENQIRDQLKAYKRFFSELEKIEEEISQRLKYVPEEQLVEMKGLAEAVGIDYRVVFMAHLFSLFRHGCTHFIAMPEATAMQKLLVARNLDTALRFHSGNVAEFYKTIVVKVHQPKSGNAFMMVATPMRVGYTGLNDKKIYCGWNAISRYDLNRYYRPNAVEHTILLRKIYQFANSLDDVSRIIDESPRSIPGIFIAVDGKTNEAKVFEVTNDSCEARGPENGFLCAANHFVISKVGNPYESSFRRYDITKRFFKKNYGKIDISNTKKVLKTLSGAYEGDVTTYHSAIVEPSELTIWAAAREKGRTAPRNKYIKFNLAEELKK